MSFRKKESLVAKNKTKNQPDWLHLSTVVEVALRILVTIELY